MTLEDKRKELDIIDRELVSVFERRLDIVRQIAEIKKENQLPIKDTAREKQVISKVCSLCKKENKQAVLKLYTEIFKISKQIEE